MLQSLKRKKAVETSDDEKLTDLSGKPGNADENPARGPSTPPVGLTDKEKLLALYQTLKDLGINSIGDLEVKISRL